MTYYYKEVIDGIITMFGSMSRPTEIYEDISEEKYKELEEKKQNKPSNTLDVKYVLDNETEEYIEVETTHDEKVMWYVSAITDGTMTIDDVPEEFKSDVQALLPVEPVYPYGLSNEQIEDVEQVYRDKLESEVANA